MKNVIYYFLILTGSLFGQQSGVLPFTGASYISQGIYFKEFDIELDEHTWTANKLPINKQFKIKLVEPKGFFQEGDDVYPGVEVAILSLKGDTLGYNKNIFGDEMESMDASILKNLSLMLTFNEMSKVGDTIIIYGNFFDKKSSNKICLKFPMIIVAPELPLYTSNSIYGASSYEGYNAKASGVEISQIETTRDSLFMPKKLFHTIRVAEIVGTSVEEVKAGTFDVWLYDQKMELMNPVDKTSFYVVKSLKDESKVNILSKIPINPEDPNNTQYTARLRWESVDGTKIIDVVSKISH